jgi:hypothetical protein
MTIAIDYSKKNDFEHARHECARLLPLIHAAIDNDSKLDQMLLEAAYDYWVRRMEILSGLAELANPDFEAEVKAYSREVAKWLMMQENGQLDADMKFPTFPSRDIPF